MPDNSPPQPTLPSLLAQSSCLDMSLHDLLQKPPVSPNRRGQNLRHEPHSLCPCRPSPIVLNRCVRSPYLTLQLC